MTPIESKAPFSIRDVVDNGLCVGCGACSVASRGKVSVGYNAFLAQEASLAGADADEIAAVDPVCPFSDAAKSEDEIAQDAFSSLNLQHDAKIGLYDGLYAGRITDERAILESSSGGLTSWLLATLLGRGDIEGVIHVGYDRREVDSPMFSYQISANLDDLQRKKKSQYYSTTFAEIVDKVRGDGRRYAFVGVPCFIKAMRLVCQRDAALADQISPFVGLVCGHLKSGAFAEVMAAQVGVDKDKLSRVDFRVKNPAATANAYDFAACDTNEAWHATMSRELLGGNWGHALFQLEACDYCDDIFAETADVCFGDAWLPKYESCWQGTNVVVSRSRNVTILLDEARAAGEITLDILSYDEMAATQSGNFRHRREGLSVRLQDAVDAGKRVPAKRIRPGSIKVSRFRRRLIRLRRQMAQRSHESYRESQSLGDIGAFNNEMAVYARDMYRIYAREKTLSPRVLAYLVVKKVKALIPFKVRQGR